jgi:hypothetical protein
VKRPLHNRFGSGTVTNLYCNALCNGHSPTETSFRSVVTAMAVGQRQRLYSGVGMLTGNYLSSTPRALRCAKGPNLNERHWHLPETSRRMVYWGADRRCAQSRVIAGLSLGTQLSTDATPAVPQLFWNYRHYKPTILAFLRCLYLHYYPSYDEKKTAQNWTQKPKRQARLFWHLFRLPVPRYKTQRTHKQAEFSRQGLSWSRIKEECLRMRTQGKFRKL